MLVMTVMLNAMVASESVRNGHDARPSNPTRMESFSDDRGKRRQLSYAVELRYFDAAGASENLRFHVGQLVALDALNLRPDVRRRCSWHLRMFPFISNRCRGHLVNVVDEGLEQQNEVDSPGAKPNQ